MLKIKLLKIKHTSDNQDINLGDFFEQSNEVKVIQKYEATFVNDKSEKYWSILIFYELKEQTFFSYKKVEEPWTSDQHELYAILDDWAKQKAKQIKKKYLSVRSQSQIYEIAENYKKYNAPRDFTMIRNYGKIRFTLLKFLRLSKILENQTITLRKSSHNGALTTH
jgi:hypothetical protein